MSGLPDTWPSHWPWDPAGIAVRSERGMVASTDRLATEVGVDVLHEGGSAVDAAVAVGFALAVVNPEAGNLGGGGFLLARTDGGEVSALDFRSAAPRAARPDLYRGRDGELSVIGHLAVAVPGSVRGLAEAHRRLGRLPWERLVEPAVSLARGFTVTERLIRSYEPHVVEGLRRFAASAEVFLPGGAPPEPGATLRQPDLARTLERIREGGADAFYRGRTADLIAAEMERGGGLVDREDLASYRAVWREPVRFRYRGRTVLSMPPPSSGGITLTLTAGLLEGHDLGALPWHGTRHVHLLAEAWRRAFADRNHHLADPDFADVPAEVLTSEAYGRWRSGDLATDRATPSAEVGAGVDAFLAGGESHTTHLSVVGPRGDSASVTTTLNTWYGSKVTVEGAGFLLNNEMDDLSTRPGKPNHFGLVQGEANRVEPGKRPLSAMTPTLVLEEDGGLGLVVGTPGGATILTTVFQVLSNLVDHRMGLGEAVVAPRVHHQHLPDRIDVEPGGLPDGVVRSLEAMGHAVREREEWSGDVQAVRVHPDGTLEGVADPRRGGVAAGI